MVRREGRQHEEREGERDKQSQDNGKKKEQTAAGYTTYTEQEGTIFRGLQGWRVFTEQRKEARKGWR